MRPHNRWWAAALALAAVGGATALRAQNAGEKGFPYGDLKDVTLQGRMVVLQEELAKKYGAQVAGGGLEKQWALALPEGQYYTFLDTSGYRKLVAAKPADGAVEVRARQFPRSQILEVVSFKAVPGDTLARRFYCGVCVIYFQDFGPCVCCGKEVELVK
jgi:hypothetical protein